MASENVQEQGTEPNSEVPKNEVKIEYEAKNENEVRIKKCYFYVVIKRAFDILLSFVFGVIMLIPMLIIAAVVSIDSPGSPLYTQERLGKDGKVFVMYKFRSMVKNAEEDGPRWADVNDERCTRVGKFLRFTRLDELPQLWNIFKGDMSFVGPRPEREYFYNEFEKYIPDFRKRLAVKPGLTGLAQVNGGYDLEPEEKLQLDIEYINNRSVILDLKCIFKTFRLVFTHEGAR